MKLENDNLSTPIYLKTDKHMDWPKDKLFYLLSSDGLFLCRNHEWFTSCSLAKRGPGELEGQQPFAAIKYPKVPKVLMEKALSFFRRIEEEHHWEAALILVWNRETQSMDLVCPDQKASDTSVKYDIPKLGQHLALIGDIHSHCNLSPNPSITDEHDEFNRPGLHLIAGRINDKTVQFYAAIVIDGQRFDVAFEQVVEGYGDSNPASAPAEWLDKVKPEYKQYAGGYYYGDYASDGYEGSSSMVALSPKDMKLIKKLLADFMLQPVQPKYEDVRAMLYNRALSAGYKWCEVRAAQFIKEWNKAHEKETTQSATAR
jgi:PRTRC genetic system protein A